jgi:hypothetical protein
VFLAQIASGETLKEHCDSIQLMKPAFTIVRDESTKCFLLFIRGATSTKDRLTAATAAEVPFQHSVSHDGCKPNLVAGHAHCGMVAAARWIADQAIPCLSKAVEQFPDYRVKVTRQNTCTYICPKKMHAHIRMITLANSLTYFG